MYPIQLYLFVDQSNLLLKVALLFQHVLSHLWRANNYGVGAKNIVTPVKVVHHCSHHSLEEGRKITWEGGGERNIFNINFSSSERNLLISAAAPEPGLIAGVAC